MREAHGDIWTFHETMPICIPTNGSVRKDGSAVMGRGVALQAKKRFPSLPWKLGVHIQRYSGNRVNWFADCAVFSFPVKHEWREKADIVLIERSARELMAFIGLLKYQSVALPRPGCGNGGLKWEEVKPVIAPVLDDRVVVVTR